jgi:hypothetical protein
MSQNTLDFQIFEFNSFLDFILKLTKPNDPEQEIGYFNFLDSPNFVTNNISGQVEGSIM